MEYFVAYTILTASILGLAVSINALTRFKDKSFSWPVCGFTLTFMLGLAMVDGICC